MKKSFIFTLILSLVVISNCVFAAAAELEGECDDGLQGPLKSSIESTRVLGRQVTYTYFPERRLYRFKRDIPELKNTVMIHIDGNGHAMFRAPGGRFDFDGTPLWGGVEVIPRKFSMALPRGMVIAIHHPPAGFEEQFQKVFAAASEQPNFLTCVSGACNYLRQLGVLDARHLSASGLLRAIFNMSERRKNELGIEFIGLGEFFPTFYEKVLWEDREFRGAILHPRVLFDGSAWADLFNLLLRPRIGLGAGQDRHSQP